MGSYNLQLSNVLMDRNKGHKENDHEVDTVRKSKKYITDTLNSPAHELLFDDKNR